MITQINRYKYVATRYNISCAVNRCKTCVGVFSTRVSHKISVKRSIKIRPCWCFCCHCPSPCRCCLCRWPLPPLPPPPYYGHFILKYKLYYVINKLRLKYKISDACMHGYIYSHTTVLPDYLNSPSRL